MVDGIDSNDPWMAQSMMNAVMAAGDAGTMLPIDAIDEFKTQQNPGAEYGWKPGAIVNVGIKSGSNALHGTAYAYGRDGFLGRQQLLRATRRSLRPRSTLSNTAAASAAASSATSSSSSAITKRSTTAWAIRFSTMFRSLPPASAIRQQNLIGACNAALSHGNLSALSAQLAGLSTTCAPLSNYPGLFPVNTGSDDQSTTRRSPA